MKKLLTTMLSSIVLASLTALPVHAATGDFTIYPTYKHGDNTSWIIFDAKQGSTVQESVTVENLTEKPLTLNLEMFDASENNGTFLIQENTEKNQEQVQQKTLSSWINLKTKTVTLQPFEKTQIPIEVTIPQNADLKEHKASILASKSELNNQNILVTTRIGVRVYANILESTVGQVNIFATPEYTQTMFFFLSIIGLISAIFYNFIHHVETKKYAKT